MFPIGCPSRHLSLASTYILKHMISCGTCENGITFTIFSTRLSEAAVLKRQKQLDNIAAYIFELLFQTNFILLYLHLWPVCMHIHQIFPPTFMSTADFVVANVMLSSILTARHQAVKLFQSSELNASKA